VPFRIGNDFERESIMARSCDLTGKRRLVGNKVSHAKNRTKMTQKPNLQTKRVFDPETGQTIKLKLSTRAIRTLDKVGSLSKFMRKYRHLFQ
jgi:large subunit ribosomal protein L28